MICTPHYCASDKNEMGGACSSDGKGETCTVCWVGKPEGKKPLVRPRCRWEDNITMGLQEVGYGGMDCVGLAQYRDRWRALVNAVMIFGFHKMRRIS
jgi:hypothetical protein